jgi:hypothetical protein
LLQQTKSSVLRHFYVKRDPANHVYILVKSKRSCELK